MPELLCDDAITDGITLVGPGGDPGVREAASVDYGTDPFVYVSLGTTVYWQPDLFRRIFAGAKRAGIGVLASVGALSDELGDAGSHVKLARYVPQLDVLARASAFVTHGGYNSASEGLRAGIPMIAIPIALDQPLTAHYIELSGVGRSIPRGEVEEELVAEALSSVLDPTKKHREIAKGIGRRWAAHDAYGDAAKHIFAAL